MASANGTNRAYYAQFPNYRHINDVAGRECHSCGCGAHQNSTIAQRHPNNHPSARRKREPRCANVDCGHRRCYKCYYQDENSDRISQCNGEDPPPDKTQNLADMGYRGQNGY